MRLREMLIVQSVLEALARIALAFRGRVARRSHTTGGHKAGRIDGVTGADQLFATVGVETALKAAA